MRKISERIATVDKERPYVNSVIETNPDALEIAGALDRNEEKGPRGRCRNTHIDQGQHCDGGPDADDCWIACFGRIEAAGGCVHRKQLRDAGAVILENKFERMGEYSLEPFDQRMERTRRADEIHTLWTEIHADRVRERARIAANLAAIGIGTETDGSIVCPSSANGLAGIKPRLAW